MDPPAGQDSNMRLIKALTCLMFLMFAMTTDAVGSVIPQIVGEFHLNLKAAGAFHYVSMAAIAVGALMLGFLADRLGRKSTIMLGLALYGTGSALFAAGDRFGFFVVLVGIAGLGVSIFKIGALALIGDISRSTGDHTALMNTLEGFFGLGSIIGPAIVAVLIGNGLSWKWLYVVAAAVCTLLACMALAVRYPQARSRAHESVNLARTVRLLRDGYALGFSLLVALYVAVEVAIYVWMPTYLQGYRGDRVWLATYALTVFFLLRAAGRFLGAWVLSRYSWTAVLVVFSLAIALCFAGSFLGGVGVGVFLLPLSGLFMSMIYPTLNSKGISCFPKAQHGAAAGIILFFTALSAALGPLAMGAVSDAYGDPRSGFVLASGFALLLCAGLLINWWRAPAERRLQVIAKGCVTRQ
jgi:fucose permease